MTTEAELDKEVAVAGFRLARKISDQCKNERAYVVMFALAALVASGLKQRDPSYSLEFTRSLHDDLINQIQADTFEKLRKESLED